MGFHTLNIGVTAMRAAQLGLDTVGHNMANVDTPGYSRQILNQSAASALRTGQGISGQGVEVNTITRVVDEFLERQVRNSISSYYTQAGLTVGYQNIETYLNELTTNDLSSAMDDFWDALGDFSTNIESASDRRSFIEAGISMSTRFQQISSQLSDYMQQLNQEVIDGVNSANALIEEIADLNKRIISMEQGGASDHQANDLRDTRAEKLKDLSALMDIDVTTESNGSVVVTQGTRLLVYSDQTYLMSTREETINGITVQMPVYAKDNSKVNFTAGTLAASTKLRDEILPSYLQEIDQLAADFIWQFNRLHTQGTGLIGYSNLISENQVQNPGATLDQINFDFSTMPGTYEIKNGNFEILVYDAKSGSTTTLGIEIDLDGKTAAGYTEAEGDTILYDRDNPNNRNSLVNKIQTALNSVDANVFRVSLTADNRLQIETTSDNYQFGFGKDTSGVLAALGLNTYFTGYDAGSISVSSNLEKNPNYLAGATTFVDGDNSNALKLIELRDARILSANTLTLDESYQAIIGRLGVESNQAKNQASTQYDILVRVENERESVSGVNLDEELTKMIMYQRSFQAAGKFISTVDLLYETLISM